jgi:hypothetical protein
MDLFLCQIVRLGLGSHFYKCASNFSNANVADDVVVLRITEVLDFIHCPKFWTMDKVQTEPQ